MKELTDFMKKLNIKEVKIRVKVGDKTVFKGQIKKEKKQGTEWRH